jgi:DNA-binding IclR family transcriptional regulator
MQASGREGGARRVAAVTRATVLLAALAADRELGTNELARRIGVNASTAARLRATLADAGYVEQTESGRYRLGVGLVQLGAAALDGLDLRSLARPVLERLVEETGETATLSLPGAGDAVTVDFVRSPSAVQGVAQLGRPSVSHATAAGKVVLAFAGVTLPSGQLQPYTEHTIVDRAALLREVEQVRAQGWAVAVGEREPDLAAVAAPVVGSRGELAAVIGLQGPAIRFDAMAREQALPLLVGAAETLSARLGWGAGAPPETSGAGP